MSEANGRENRLSAPLENDRQTYKICDNIQRMLVFEESLFVSELEGEKHGK